MLEPMAMGSRFPPACLWVAATFLAFLLPGATFADDVSPAPRAGECGNRSIVVVSLNPESGHETAWTRWIETAVAGNGCFRVTDAVDSIEAGMAAELDRIASGRSESITAQGLLLDMRLREARDGFQRAVDDLESAFAHLVLPSLLGEAWMYLGVSRAATGDRKGARVAFTEALRLIPGARPADFGNFSEAEIPFREALRGIESGGSGSLHIDSNPAAAEAWVDGEFAGITPLDLPMVSSGTHRIVLRKPGFVRKSIRVTVPDKGTVTVNRLAGELEPARRKPLLDTALGKLRGVPSDADRVPGIEDLKALFMTDLALIVDVHEDPEGFVGRVALWDLATGTRVWTGQEPESGYASVLGRGGAEALVTTAFATDLERTRMPESATARSGSRHGVISQWWFWTGIGLAVAGGVTAAVLLTRPRASAPDGIPSDGTGAVVVRF